MASKDKSSGKSPKRSRNPNVDPNNATTSSSQMQSTMAVRRRMKPFKRPQDGGASCSFWEPHRAKNIKMGLKRKHHSVCCRCDNIKKRRLQKCCKKADEWIRKYEDSNDSSEESSNATYISSTEIISEAYAQGGSKRNIKKKGTGKTIKAKKQSRKDKASCDLKTKKAALKKKQAKSQTKTKKTFCTNPKCSCKIKAKPKRKSPQTNKSNKPEKRK